MIPYILHVTVILTVCFLFYKLFLQKATFYRLNRWTLFSCLILSFVLPLLPAPRGWTWNPAMAGDPVATKPGVTKPGVTRPGVTKPVILGSPAFSPSSVDPMAPETVARGIYPSTTKPVTTKPAPAEATLRPGPTTLRPAPTTLHHDPATILPATPPSPSHPFGALLLQGLKWLSYLYCLGLLVLGLKFFLQIFLLCYRSFTRPVIRDDGYRIVETSDDRGPCTFANTIFINPLLYDPDTFRQILVHEKIHVSGGHTLDILLAELAVVLQWFNPFVWLYRREVEDNLEFLTDRSVLENSHVERLAYQLSLLRVAAPHLPFSITNNYNQSLLKRRIVMMNSRHSARHTIWKYFVLLPILTLLVCTLNKPAALGQSEQANTQQRQTATASQAMPPATATKAIPPNTATLSDTTIHRAGATANKAEAATISVAPATASVDPQVTTIKGTFTSVDGTVTTVNGTVSIQAATPITANTSSNTVAATNSDTTGPRSTNENTHFSESTNIQSGSFIDMRQGSWFLTVDNDDMEFNLRAQSGENSWRTTFTVKKSEIDPYPGQGTVEFKLVREAGTMTFKGSFDGEQGLGHFQFQPDETYFDEMQKMGVEDMDEHSENSFFVVNVTRDFVRMLNRDGYTPIGQQDVVSLAIHKIDEPFLKYWKSSGVEGADEVRNLFLLKMLHIEPVYVEDLKKAGYTNLNIGQLIRLKRQGIDGNYVRAMSTGNPTPVAPEELLLYKMMHIDPGYLNSLRKIGYDHLNQSEIRELYNAGVTADYIKGFQDAGFSAIPVQKLVMLKMRNASPEDAKSFRSLGYADLDIERITLLKNQGITPDFVNAFHKIGYDNIPVNTLYMLKMSGVDANYVAKMKASGLNSPDLMKYVQLKREFN